MENKSGLRVILCLTCGGTRLAVTSEEGVAAAKAAIWDIPRHRGHFLDVQEAAGDGFLHEVKESTGHFMIFDHVLHPPRRVGRD
ncbi:hypothetical protein HYV64_04755 [Candidatus Shapirobacteria bacterium]|nr:hypothetical protein [Candidatus Shapirobacteria bacterium]